MRCAGAANGVGERAPPHDGACLEVDPERGVAVGIDRRLAMGGQAALDLGEVSFEVGELGVAGDRQWGVVDLESG